MRKFQKHLGLLLAMLLFASSFSGTVSAAGEVNRLYGSNRFETAMKLATDKRGYNFAMYNYDYLKGVIVTTGNNFPDALSAAYLSVYTGYPLLLSIPSKEADIIDYIQENCVAGEAEILVVGGPTLITDNFMTTLRQSGYSVPDRITGKNRYETNMAIINWTYENGDTPSEFLVCSGENYPDALSASSTGLPVLLVGKSLTDAQRNLIANTGASYCIIGGEGVVSKEIANEIGSLSGSAPDRIGGVNRYDTSFNIAAAFGKKSVVFVSGTNFPDGLCAGLFAYLMKSQVVLMDNTETAIQRGKTFVDSLPSGLNGYIAIGGPTILTDETIKRVVGD